MTLDMSLELDMSELESGEGPDVDVRTETLRSW